MSSAPARKKGWLATTSTVLPLIRGDRAHDVACPALVDLHELAIVGYRGDDASNVVRLARIGRDAAKQLTCRAVDRVAARERRYGLSAVRRKKGNQVPHVIEATPLVVMDEAGEARDACVDRPPNSFMPTRSPVTAATTPESFGPLHLL